MIAFQAMKAHQTQGVANWGMKVVNKIQQIEQNSDSKSKGRNFHSFSFLLFFFLIFFFSWFFFFSLPFI